MTVITNPPLPTIIARTTVADAAGTYTQYTFSDGHISTDPPNRPVSKEDLQRQIRDTLAQTLATQSLTNEQARYTKTAAQKAAPNAQAIARADFDVISGGLVTKAFNAGVNNFSAFAPTMVSPEGMLDTLVASVNLGGELPNNEGTEYITPAAVAGNQSNVNKNYNVQTYPAELRRAPG